MKGTQDRHWDAKKQRLWTILPAMTLLGFAALLRIRGAQNGLWLDEIWSLNLAGQISSPLDVFHKINRENNHYLNTLFLYLMGPRGDWPGYRIPSVLAGIGTVAVAGLIGRARDRTTAFLAMFLVGFSYILVLYSSEARGYSALVFFSFLSYYCMDYYLKNRRWPAALGFSLSSSLGFLSHLTFLNFFLAAFLWTCCRLIRSSPGFKAMMVSLASCYALPTLVVIILYRVDIRRMQMGGGMEPGLFNCYEAAAAWVLGLPPLTAIGAGLTTLLFALGMQMLWREDRDAMVFFFGSAVAAPLLLIWATDTTVIYARFFLVPIAFSLILLSFFLGSLCRRTGAGGKIVLLLVLGGYLVANGWHLMTLFQYGRGDDREALCYVLENTRGSIVTVGGDQDFRIGTVLQFYAANGLDQKTLRYDTQGFWPSEGVEWLICQQESFEDPVAPTAVTAAGHFYELARVFPAAPLSGLHWFVYQRRADYHLILHSDP